MNRARALRLQVGVVVEWVRVRVRGGWAHVQEEEDCEQRRSFSWKRLALESRPGPLLLWTLPGGCHHQCHDGPGGDMGLTESALLRPDNNVEWRGFRKKKESWNRTRG